MLDYLDDWESKYIKNLKDYDVMAWSDPEAELRYPKYNFVYDKYLLSKYTKVYTVDLEKELPKLYPVVVKPRKNMQGLSKNAYIACSYDEIEDYQGYIAQEYLSNRQYTSDLLLRDGKVVAHYSFITHKNMYHEIKLFSSIPFMSPKVAKKVAEILPNYTGVVNVEYIGTSIIEMHLRPSLQFYDICGGFIATMPSFVKNPNVLPSISFESTFSRVYRTRHDGKVQNVNMPQFKPSTVRSVQLAWEDGYLLSETDLSLFRKRYLIINGTSLPDIENYGNMFKIHIGG